MENLEKEIELIKERNRRVEADKAWERSKIRVFSITAATYIIAAIVMYKLRVNKYLLNALIPAVGYFLSTQSLPIVKKWWIKNFWK